MGREKPLEHNCCHSLPKTHHSNDTAATSHSSSCPERLGGGTHPRGCPDAALKRHFAVLE
jgi:hypothetical protein